MEEEEKEEEEEEEEEKEGEEEEESLTILAQGRPASSTNMLRGADRWRSKGNCRATMVPAPPGEAAYRRRKINARYC